MFAGGEAEADEEVALAGAGVAEQHDGFPGVEVVPGGELAEGGGLQGGDGVDVEVGEPFQAGELGVVDAAGPATFGAVVDLGGEDFGEVGQVGLAFPVGDLGQPGRLGPHGGQVQLTGGGADRGLRCSIDRTDGAGLGGRAGGGHGRVPVVRRVS